MIYNMNFIIAALIFLLIIFFHFLEQCHRDLGNNRTFLMLILLGMANILFDVLCTVLITRSDPELALLTKLSLMILYLLQVMVPYALMRHMQAFFELSNVQFGRIRLLWIVPPAMMIFLIFWNHWSGVMFYIDETGQYIRGPLYEGMYIFTIFYMLTIAISSIIYAKKLGLRKFIIIWEMLFFAGGCAIIQAVWHDILLSGFGIALGITVLFFTLNNPYHYTDNLTDTYDVEYFHERMKSMFKHGKTFHFISIELSQVKRIHFLQGTEIGNRVIINTAQMLRLVGKKNLIFRLSASRFLLMVTSLAEYESALRCIQDYFSDPAAAASDSIRSAAVICGISNAEKLENSSTVVSYVEYLTTLTKPGSDTILIQGDDETKRGFRHAQMIEGYLETALEEDLFEVYYQPVYSTEKNRYITLEALSRLRHPTLGPVSPDVFISIAEKNDQISLIGLLQLKRICRFIKKNEDIMKQIRNIKINLSPAELMKSGHVSRLIQIIRESGLSPSYFQFEITETVATEYNENLNQAVSEFIQAGIGLCLDDFGSGYANFNTILKLPFSVIKLDRSLLIGICEDNKVASFYRNIVSVLQNMDYSVVAEGIETEEELELVSQWGVNMIQGYYFSRPLPEREILKILTKDTETQ